MRIVLMWPRPEQEVAPLIEGLKEDGHEIVYFVGDRTEHCNPAGSIYHDHYDAWDGKPAPALTDVHIPPLSGEEIKAYPHLESMILTMMNKHFDTAPVDQRKHIYYAGLAYWKYILRTLKPETILFPIVPHSIYNYILYELAQEKNIPTLMFEETVFEGRLLPYRDFRKSNDALLAALKDNLSRGVTVEDLNVEIRDHFLHHRGSKKNSSKPWYQRELEKRVGGRGLWEIRARALLHSLSNGSTFRLVFSYFGRQFKDNLKSEYQRLIKAPDYSKPYVYFPLQFQPERTSSPQGDMYHDQLLAIETLSEALPEGWEIYVKEHPSQWLIRTKTRFSSARWQGYYEQIARIANVRLVPIETNTYELTEHSRTVAVIAGSAGWEALLRSKKPLVFGWVWYRDCPGVRIVRSVEQCAEALSDVQASARHEKDILAFLKAFEQVSVRTHIAQSADSRYSITAAEGSKAILQVVLKELNEYKIRLVR